MKLNPVAITTLLTATLAFSSFARAENQIKWTPSATNKQILYDQNNVTRFKNSDVLLVHFYNSTNKNDFRMAIGCGSKKYFEIIGDRITSAQNYPPNSVLGEVNRMYCPSNNDAVSNYAHEMEKATILNMYRQRLRTTYSVSQPAR